MTKSEPILDARLREMIANWNYEVSPRSVLALGPAAFKRLIDKKLWGTLRSPGADPRDYQYAFGEAIQAFARHDLAGSLDEMRKSDWDDLLIARYVGGVRDPRVVPLLLALYASDSPFDRANAVEALGTQRDPLATQTLINALSDRSADVRYAAVEALGEAGDPTAIEPLRDFAKHARKDRVATHARSTIAKIQKAVRSRKKKKS